MGQNLSLPCLLGMTDAKSIACLDHIESDLLLYIARVLIHEKPAAIGRLLCCCRTLALLASADSVGEELRKARRLVAREWLFDLRALGGLQPAALAPLVTQVTRQLSFTALHPDIDEPSHLDMSRWHRPARPDPRHAAPHEAEWTTRGTALKRVLYANQSLVSVDVSVCYLTHMDAVEIAKGLTVNKSLTALDASGNFFGGYGRDGKFIRMPDGMGAIADALLVSMLTSLTLAENRLGPEGIRALVPGLASSSLTSLDLSRNGIGADGATELADGLAVNRSLLKLDVRLNELGPGGAKALAPGVAACGSLRALDVRFNGLGAGDEGEAALKGATKDRPAFRLLVLNT